MSLYQSDLRAIVTANVEEFILKAECEMFPDNMTNRSRRFFTFAIVGIVFIFVLLIFAQASKKFVLDAVDFPVLAKAISETGLPYHYRGEADVRSLGLWHPPLYAYGLAVFIKIFGFSENIVRAFGMCSTLISAFLSILIYKALFKISDTEKYLFATIFLSIFLWHPYTIANATVPDIDSTVLPVAMLGFLYGLVNFQSVDSLLDVKWPFKSSIMLSVLFAISLWAKLTTPLVLIPTTFFVLYIQGWSLRKSVGISISIAVVGALLFLATYGLYCHLLKLPFDFTFKFLLFSFTKNASSGGGLPAFFGKVIEHLSYARQFVNSIGLVFVFAVTLALGSLLFQKKRSKSDSTLLVFTGMGVFVNLFYLSLTGAFGGFFKYPYSVFAIFILVITRYICKNLSVRSFDNDWISSRFGRVLSAANMEAAWMMLLSGVAVVVCYYQVSVVRDAITYQEQPVSYLALPVVTGVALVMASLSVTQFIKPFVRYGVLFLVVVLVVSQLRVSRSQAVAAYPTTYHFGQTGLDETVAYLRNEVRPNEVIWAMKDVGHYVGGGYIENYQSIFKPLPDMLRDLTDLIEIKQVRYFVVTRNIGQDRVDAYSDLKSALETCCSIDREFGNFVIYKAKQHE